jgi:hypothetical protein
MADIIVQRVVDELRQDPAHAEVPDDFWTNIAEVLSDSRYWIELGVQVVPMYDDYRQHIEQALATWHFQHDQPLMARVEATISEATEVLPASLAEGSDQEIVRALTSAPEGTSLAESPLGRRMIHEDNNPSRWAALCHHARILLEAQGLGIEPSRRQAELAIEEANGTRRLPAGAWDIGRVNQLLLVAEVNIGALPPDDPERLRLENLRLYHGGQANIAVGRFGAAAGYYEQAAAIATTPFSLGLNTYFVAYCRLQDALIQGDEEEIRTHYVEFYAGSERFIAVLDRSVETQLRWYGNVLCHQRMFDWLCGKEERMANITSLVEIGELEPRAAFKDACALLGAAYLSRQSRSLSQLAYRQTLDFAHDEASAIEWRALAFLFLAEIEEGRGEQDRVRATLDALINLGGNGGHVAKAIARRRLERLGGASE